MYLKRLDIAGFKSFAKKCELQFNTPVTSIVGPNGSGKSNVVEAVRFVLGEQSMKSLRGKAGSDLIFNGSKSLPKGSRASVSIVFDNTGKIFKLTGANEGKVSLDFDEITLTREVWSDGVNHYSVNGTEVRLKDINEILAGINIGSSGHHIISQGEADRVLNSSPKERREMLEDALGLKIYQYRLKESARKIEKTEENLKEVGLLRREIAPHINFLKKQVEKIEKAKVMREELQGLYLEYLKTEEAYLSAAKEDLNTEKNHIHSELKNIADAVREYEGKNKGAEKIESGFEADKMESQLAELRNLKDELSRKLGRIEGMLELEAGRADGKNKTEKRVISAGEVEEFIESVNSAIDEAFTKSHLAEIFPILERIKNITGKIRSTKEAAPEGLSNGAEIEKLQAGRDEIMAELAKLALREKEIQAEISALKAKAAAQREQSREKDREHFEMLSKRSELTGEKNIIELKIENLRKAETDFENEIKEGSVLVGPNILAYKNSPPKADQPLTGAEQAERKKKIERIKIKLEDVGGGGGEVTKEFEEIVERDRFLEREMEDLKKSIESLQILTKELKEKLDVEFRTGVEKINKQFQEFFELMFGGGSAGLSVVETEPRIRREKVEPSESPRFDLEEPAEETEKEQGIEIDVALPKKKIRDLHMLSGGERSLTSIALLFAISQVNPPPFLILDETDAALDEANSRKYGDMIEKLAKYSQLIVVTHNRETMSRANVLYGVTIGADGASKLLSVKFDEAVAIAK